MVITRKKILAFLVALAVPLGIGMLSAVLAGNTKEIYASLYLPYTAPPAFVFPLVWTVLFIAMGIASYLVYAAEADAALKRRCALFYTVQLAVNFSWSIVFFRFGLLQGAFWVALALFLLVCITAFYFGKAVRAAGALLMPYALWAAFAAYLSYQIAVLN